MSYSQAIILALVQGLTEFLPVSSSGHLVIFQKLFNLAEPPVLFDVLVHVGTLGAVLIYFRKELKRIFEGLKRKRKESWNVFWMVIVGTIPAAIVGLFLQNYIGQIFDSLKLVGVALLITAGFLFSTRWFESLNHRFNSFNCIKADTPPLAAGRSRSSDVSRNRNAANETFGGSRIFPHPLCGGEISLKWQDAIFIGCFQALAIIPGISRSGSTIVSGLWRKFDRETAFQFSFYLVIPAILGALVLQTPDLIYSPYGYLKQGILGMLVAGIVGYGALKILEKTLVSAKLWLFGVYCLILGTVVLLI